MSAHTPGPWEVARDERCKDAIYGVKHDGLWIAGVYASGTSAVYPSEAAVQESCANARLIAAAPDLLEALEETLNAGIGWYDDARGLDPEALGWVQKARAAIAKAKGEA